jgi:uncharacterized membrane protein
MVPAMHEIEGPVQSCPECFAQMPVGASFCPACGRSMHVIAKAQGKVGGLPENLAGALAYFTFLPAIAFLLLQPYRKNLFVRFHGLQCLLFTVATILIALLLWLASLALFAVPVLGPLLVVLVAAVAALAAIFAWLVLVIKAFQGATYKLPLLGEFAEHYAGRI